MLLLVGNWKMAPEKPAQAIDLSKKTLALARLYKKTLSVVTCVPFIHVPHVLKQAKAPLFVGAQDVAGNTEIAQTGLIGASMLKQAGVTHCIIGHSEVRARGASDTTVAEATLRLLEKNIIPIICIGERERDPQGWYLSLIKDQLETVLATIPDAAIKKIVIAYEPIWAIGDKAEREATPAECFEMVLFIRKILADHVGEKAATKVPILYGGSVNEHNAKLFIHEGGAQGLLIGRVSLEPKRFNALAKSIS
jgi:triosephosphate isomerase (TIM)